MHVLFNTELSLVPVISLVLLLTVLQGHVVYTHEDGFQ